MFTQRFCASALILMATACASGSGTASGAEGAPERPVVNQDVITAAELAEPGVASGDALQAVQKLRPRFLMARGQMSVKNTTAGSVHISVDGGSLQSVDQLSRYLASQIAEMRYINSTDATQRFGSTAGSGAVILVKSK